METKPGIYTTEFWLNLAFQIILALNTFEIWTYMPQKWSALVQAIVMAAYMVARGIAKSGVGADPALAANYRLKPERADGVTRR